MTGSVHGEWRNGEYRLNLQAEAHPLPDAQPAMTMADVDLRVSGDTNSVRIEQARVTAPWLAVQVSNEVALSFSGQLLSTQAEVLVAADLSQQPWIALRGKLTGALLAQPGQQQYPDVRFQFEARDLEGLPIEIERAGMNGRLAWPLLDLNRAEVELPSGGRLVAEARADLLERTLADARLQAKGPIDTNLLPKGVSLEQFAVDAHAHGPFTNLQHQAEVALQGLSAPKLAPLDVKANWNGTALTLDRFQASMRAGGSELEFTGGAQASSNAVTVDVNRLELVKTNETMLQLEKPFLLSLQKAGDTNQPAWSVALAPLRWQGQGRDISLQASLQWPRQGRWASAIHGFRASLFQDFTTRELPDVEVTEWQSSGAWTNSPVDFTLSCAARLFQPSGESFGAEVKMAGNGQGLAISQVSADFQSNAIIGGHGFVPVSIAPADGTNLVHLALDKPVEFSASTQPSPAFWKAIGERMKVAFDQPRIHLEVTGTLKEPEASLGVDLETIQWKPDQSESPVPPVKNLAVRVHLSPKQLELQRLQLSVEDQAITGSGVLPLTPDLTQGLEKVARWKEARAELRVDKAQIAPFAKFAPEMISPQGTIDLNLQVRPGMRLGGSLVITGAATRPIMPLGPIHDLQARLAFSEKQIDIKTFTGKLGGAPINVSGHVDIPTSSFGKGMPPFVINIRGDNVPLVRQPKVILRSDLDLSITNTPSAPAIVGGVVTLRDSFFLSDLKDLMPGGVARPSQRPPYFSIDKQPLADWRLDIRVRGDEFLRVKSPFFTGKISAHLKLEGTLQEPLALGDVKINSGNILFPFATLSVNQGLISLSSDQPHKPQLLITAASRTYGYDVKMEVTGTADDPIIEFSSTPSLNSEQILLMVTAGQLPRNEITFSNQEKMSRLGMFLGKNLLSKLGIGGQGEERLIIRSGENISDQGKETYYIEYKLTDNWSLVGEYDRFSAFNGGVKWRIYSK